jgi:hypothetical protein
VIHDTPDLQISIKFTGNVNLVNSFWKVAKSGVLPLQMSVVSVRIQVERKEVQMTKLEKLQAEYDLMVKIAMESDYDLDPQFEKELTNLMRLIKSLGGNTR